VAALRGGRGLDTGNPADDAHVAMDPTEAPAIALIQTLNPLLSALLAWPLLGEALRPSQVLGLVLGFTGVLICGLPRCTARAELPGLLADHPSECLPVRRHTLLPAFLPRDRAVARCHGNFSLRRRLPGTAILPGDLLDGRGPRERSPGIAWNTIAVSVGGLGAVFPDAHRRHRGARPVNFYLSPA